MPQIAITLRRVLISLVATATLATGFALKLKPPGPPTISRLRLDGIPTYPLAFTADNATLATFNEQRTLTLWDVSTGQPRRRLPEKTLTHSVAFSPDGRLLAYDRQYAPGIKSGTRVLRMEDFTPVLNIDEPLDGHIQFSPDGTSFCVIALRLDMPPRASNVIDGHVRSWDTSTWQEHPPRPFLPHPNGLLAFGPDGHLLASADDRRSDVLLHDVDQSSPIATLADPSSPALNTALAFSPDGLHLAVGKADGVVQVWHVPTRRLLARPQLHSPGFEPKRLLLTPSPRTLLISNAPFRGASTWSMILRQKLGTALGVSWLNPGDMEAVLYDLENAAIRRRLPGEVLSVVSPDGTRGVSLDRMALNLRVRDLQSR